MRMFDDFKTWYQSEAGQKVVSAPGLSMTGIVEVCVRWCATYADKKMVEPMTETIRQLTAKAEGQQVRAESSHLLEEARRQRDEAQMEMAALQRRLDATEAKLARLEAEAQAKAQEPKSPVPNWKKRK